MISTMPTHHNCLRDSDNPLQLHHVDIVDGVQLQLYECLGCGATYVDDVHNRAVIRRFLCGDEDEDVDATVDEVEAAIAKVDPEHRLFKAIDDDDDER